MVAPSVPSENYLGNESVKHTIIEFGDYQCTFCKRFHVYTKGIHDIATYNSSTFVSEASYCVADQTKYWEYYDQLYENSRSENTDWISQKSLIEFAALAGVYNITAYPDCISSHKYSNLVQKVCDLAM